MQKYSRTCNRDTCCTNSLSLSHSNCLLFRFQIALARIHSQFMPMCTSECLIFSNLFSVLKCATHIPSPCLPLLHISKNYITHSHTHRNTCTISLSLSLSFSFLFTLSYLLSYSKAILYILQFITYHTNSEFIDLHSINRKLQISHNYN
jgi:hypothetical protein